MDACPPLEDIAAFLDDMLPVEERARITEHLARCESCYEIFAGAIHFQEEEEKGQKDSSADGTDGGGVIQFPPLVKEQDKGGKEEEGRNKRAPRMPGWLPLAASVVLVVGLGFFTWRLLGPPRITLAGVIEPIEENAGISDVLYEEDVYRSANQHADPDWDYSAFLVGVRLVDLRLSVNARKVEETKEQLQELGNAFSAMPFFGDLEKRCADEVAALSGTEELERFARELPRLEKEIEQSLSDFPSFSFGLWTEAGRLAAVVKSPEFFERRDNRRFLSLAQKNVPVAEEIQGQVLGDLRDIERTWDEGDLSREDYEKLATHFQKIIKQIDEYEEHLLPDE